MKRQKLPEIGEYVLVSKWGDRKPTDPWFIGHLWRISIYKHFVTFSIDEDETKREYRHCWRITEEQGRAWIELYGKEDV